jgi:voltage-gated sodium channel
MERFKQLFLNDRFILIIIIVNTFAIFAESFKDLNPDVISIIGIMDHLITIIFVVEMVIKIREYGWHGYIKLNWNKMDFILVLISFPYIITFFIDLNVYDLSFLLIFRLLRAFKLLRIIKFVPKIDKLIQSSINAIKTTGVIFVAFTILLVIFSLFSGFLFGNVSPEYFGDPFKSMYSIFKIFTIEGWFEIPEAVSKNYEGITQILVTLYFVSVLFTGGIVGLSLLNSIFVDAMVSDNNNELGEKVRELTNEIKELKEMLRK